MLIPKKIKGFRSDIINSIIDYLTALTPKESSDIKPQPTNTGTTLFLKDSKKPFTPKPQENRRDLYQVPTIREWKKNATTGEVEIVPRGDENMYDPAVAEKDKNPVVVTWDSINYEDEDFGIKTIEDTVVTIYGGTIQVGNSTATTTDTSLTITTATAYVGYDYTYASNTVVISNFGVNFLRDPAHIRKWLYKFEKYTITVMEDGEEVEKTKVRLLKRGRLNDIYPANWDAS